MTITHSGRRSRCYTVSTFQLINGVSFVQPHSSASYWDWLGITDVTSTTLGVPLTTPSVASTTITVPMTTIRNVPKNGTSSPTASSSAASTVVQSWTPAIICGACALICFYMSCLACKLLMQRISFCVPLLMSTPTVAIILILQVSYRHIHSKNIPCYCPGIY
jgi:hypothetical protein